MVSIWMSTLQIYASRPQRRLQRVCMGISTYFFFPCCPFLSLWLVVNFESGLTREKTSSKPSPSRRNDHDIVFKAQGSYGDTWDDDIRISLFITGLSICDMPPHHDDPPKNNLDPKITTWIIPYSHAFQSVVRDNEGTYQAWIVSFEVFGNHGIRKVVQSFYHLVGKAFVLVGVHVGSQLL